MSGVRGGVNVRVTRAVPSSGTLCTRFVPPLQAAPFGASTFGASTFGASTFGAISGVELLRLSLPCSAFSLPRYFFLGGSTVTSPVEVLLALLG